jgi:folate-dependent phosphoribosylglycinamide formyltransferase PurN
MKIVILTGYEIRHKYFVSEFLRQKDIEIAGIFCEGIEQSLLKRAQFAQSPLLIEHANKRTLEEQKRFESRIKRNFDNHQKLNLVRKGAINSIETVEKIKNLSPDLLICYGSSLIKSELLDLFKGRFLNVHLGLSPYYLGSGSNVWPLINMEPKYVGATFMHMDPGIDTGEVIHQIQGELLVSDTPHSVGNRLIEDMVKNFVFLVQNFGHLEKMDQIVGVPSKLYRRKDFIEPACKKLYHNFATKKIFSPMDSEKVKLVFNPIFHRLLK